MSKKRKPKKIELLPCPFCGEAAAWGEGEQKTRYGNEQVYCSNCYAMTAPAGSKKEAAFLWNDRNDSSVALLAEVRAATERFESEHELLTKVVGERNELREEVGRLREALAAYVKFSDEAALMLDQDRDAKCLKLLLAMAGRSPRYRHDVDVARAALSGKKEGE